MSPREIRIAVPVLAAAAASFGLLLHGMGLQGGVERIGALRTFSVAGAEHVAVFHGDTLHLLDASGRPLARQPAGALGLGEAPNDMDITVDAQDVVHGWFLDDARAQLVRCVLEREPWRFGGCTAVLAGPALKANARSRAVHIAADPARERVFVADAKSHAVRSLGLAGQPASGSGQGLLWFPNRLRLAPGGEQLIVADNDHHRLLWLDVGGQAPRWRQARTVSVDAHPAARAGSRRAADFAAHYGADGQLQALWVLALRQGQKQGDVLIWGEGGRPGARADLGGHGDPLLIDTLGDSALVGDFDGIALYRIDAAGRYLGLFGQGAFATELAGSRSAFARGGLFVKLGWAGFALTLLAGFALAWRFGERPGRREAEQAFAVLDGAAAEVPRGTVVLEPQPGYLRQMQGTALALGAAPLAGLAFILLRARQAFDPAWLGQAAAWAVLLMAVLLVATCGSASWWLMRLARRRLVLAGGHAQVWAGARMLASVPVREVLVSPRALLVGSQQLPYRMPRLLGGPGRWIFDPEPLTRYLLAHIPAGRRLDASAFGFALMRRMPRWQKAAIALPALAWLGLELWRLAR